MRSFVGGALGVCFLNQVQPPFSSGQRPECLGRPSMGTWLTLSFALCQLRAGFPLTRKPIARGSYTRQNHGGGHPQLMPRFVSIAPQLKCFRYNLTR